MGILEAALRDAPSRQRVLALRALVRRSLMREEMWRRAMTDDDPDVRREAFAQCAYAALDEALYAEVATALGDSDPLVVDAAAFALGEHAVDNAVGALVEVARGHDDPRCREAAVAALGVIGDDRGRATILGALEDKAPVRRRAIAALANFEGADIDAALERASEDRDWQVRSAAAQLGRDDEED